MSAYHGAPGFRRPQMTTPAYSAAPQGSIIPARSGPPVIKRKAMLFAAATLCAPALAVAALGGFGATTGGNQAGMGSLAGSAGLRGSTTGAASTQAPPATAGKLDTMQNGAGKSPAGTHHARHHPGTRAGAEAVAPPDTATVKPHRPNPASRPAHHARRVDV